MNALAVGGDGRGTSAAYYKTLEGEVGTEDVGKAFKHCKLGSAPL